MTSGNTELSKDVIEYLYNNKLKIVMKQTDEGMEVYIEKMKGGEE